MPEHTSPNILHGGATLQNDPDQFRDAERALLDAVEKMQFPTASAFAVRLALEEAVVNGFKHGNRNRPDSVVRLHWSVDKDLIRITVEDEGKGFQPDDVPDPREPENLERPSGRGIMLMRAYMTRVDYSDEGNRVEMIYERPQDPPAD